MIKRIIFAIMIFAVSGVSTFAVAKGPKQPDDGWGTDTDKCIKINDRNIGFPEYVIYFENDKPKISKECKAEVQKISDAIEQLNPDDVSAIIIIGSASNTASDPHDTALSVGRIATAHELIENANPALGKKLKDCDTQLPDDECNEIAAGHANASRTNNGKTGILRQVDIYIRWALAACTPELRKDIKQYLAMIDEEIDGGNKDKALTEFKSKLEAAQKACGDEKHQMLKSEEKKIQDLLTHTLQHYDFKYATATASQTVTVYMEDYTASNYATLINNAYAQISSMASTFDRSVWRNANGEFNTSRLVSDTVAGVVLGTAGGIITSNIIKKNQLNNGYEDLQCTIGGQVVAGYDDQFTVGIQ